MPPPKPNYQNQPTPSTRVLLLFVVLVFTADMASGQSGWYDVVPQNGKYQIPYTQTPDPLVSSNAAANSNAVFQWQIAPSPDDGSFTNIAGAASANLSFSAPITGVVFYRRVSTVGSQIYTSNIIRLEAASANTEDLNYTRSHSVLVPAKTTWQQVDALPIGDKLVSTTYMDGLGRPLQQVSTGVATPTSPGGTWGDVVQYNDYDKFGRSPRQFLPYTTTTNAGKYKPNALNEQGNYYNSKYADAAPFSQATYDESPLNRVINMKLPGQAWASSAGNSAKLLLNTDAANVQRFTIDYASSDGRR